MLYMSEFWKKLTEKSLEQSHGKLETAFFESVYRIKFFSGLSTTGNLTLPYRIYQFIVKATIVLLVISELLYLFRASNGLDAFVENINVSLIHVMVVYRYKRMEDSSEFYNRLAKSMDTPTFDILTPGRKRIFRHWKNINEKYYKLLLILAVPTLSIWYTYPLIDCVEYNLPASLWLPFEYKTPERYAITYVITLTMFHFIAVFVVVNDVIMQTYFIHLICQFAVLSDCFENILNDCVGNIKDRNDTYLFSSKRFRQKYLRRLNDIVEQHKFLLDNTTNLQIILSRPLLVQLLASGTLICFAGYQCTTSVSENFLKFLLSLLYLSYNMFIFYLVCRWCDEIKLQSENISRAVYFSGWERGAAVAPGVRIRLMMVVARASRPLVLTAGGLYDVSLMSYTTLVKTSYSALTVLLRMRKR